MNTQGVYFDPVLTVFHWDHKNPRLKQRDWSTSARDHRLLTQTKILLNFIHAINFSSVWYGRYGKDVWKLQNLTAVNPKQTSNKYFLDTGLRFKELSYCVYNLDYVNSKTVFILK